MSELWKDIPDFLGYEVSDLGNVRVRKSGGRYRDLSQHTIEQGYRRVNLWSVETGHVKKLTHVLVCRTFNGEPPIGEVIYEVNHKDGNKANNVPGNLEWKTGSGNMQHALETGLTRYNLRITVCDSETGQTISYPSMNAVSRDLNITPDAIKRLLGHPDKPMYNNRYIFNHEMSEHVPAHKTHDKIVAFDHTTGIRLIAINASQLSVLTGVLSATILNTIRKGDLGMIAGYSFKWFKDGRALPSFKSEEAMVSRVHYFMRKSRTSGVVVKYHPTGTVATFEQTEDAVEATGILGSTIKTFINGGSLLPFRGYSFKRVDNPAPFPEYDEDQVAASLIRKSRGAVPYKVTDTYTGKSEFYPSLKDTADYYGWSRSAVSAWLDKYPGVPYLVRWLAVPIDFE